jgi:hypothetical protein
MTRAWSRVPWLGVWGALALVLASLPARTDSAGVAGVRSTSVAIREMLDDGAWESPTFRGLVREIAAYDGIVYVEEGVCRHGVHACLLLHVTQASGYRFLKILIDLQGVLAHRRREDMIATIGHELGHAVEVLAQRAITDTAAIYQFYGREAATTSSTFETPAAIAAGRRVRGELDHGITFVWQQVALDAGR